MTPFFHSVRHIAQESPRSSGWVKNISRPKPCPMNPFINCLNDFWRRIECIQCGCTGGCKFCCCHHLFCLFIFSVPRCVVRIKRFRNPTESGIRMQHREFLLSGLPTISIQIVDNLHSSEIPLKDRTFPCRRFHVCCKVNLRKIYGISIACFSYAFFRCWSNFCRDRRSRL